MARRAEARCKINMLRFFKVSNETDTNIKVRSDSLDQGDSSTVYPLEQSNLQVSSAPLSDNFLIDMQETHDSPLAANTNSSLATLMTGSAHDCLSGSRLLESRD
jgi:hypothetical protein